MRIELLFSVMLISVFSIGVRAQNNSTTQVIAHRGAWKTNNLPQNSLASLDRAIELGCYGSEFDVHITKDDVVVVNHDNDYLGLVIATSTYQELLEKKMANGESIPTLEAYLREGAKQKGTRLICEIKTSSAGKERTTKLVELTVGLVKKCKAGKIVDYITFDLEAGKYLARLAPKNSVAYLSGDLAPADAKAAGYSSIDYHHNVYDKNPGWVGEAQKLGLTVNAWTVDKEEDMKKLIDLKVDFITTNEPELLFHILKGK